MSKKTTHKNTDASDVVLPPPALKSENIEAALGFIEARWGELERSNSEDKDTLIGLPHPYFAPSTSGSNSIKQDEIHYWDTYFIVRGLLGTKREDQAYEQADNLLHLLRRFGVVPAANRFHATSRSHPPMLTSLLMDLYDWGGNKEWLAPRMELAKEEYRSVWRGSRHPHWREVFKGLSRHYDVNELDALAECESGWEYTTRFSGKALQHIPIDLNSLLYKCEMDFMRSALISGKPKEAQEWQKAAKERKEAIDTYLWNQNAGFYFDYNYCTGRSSNVWSLASYYSLWTGLASEEQAARMAEHIDKFEYNGGLVPALEYPAVSEHQPAQWSYPNGLAPLHLVVIEGLAKYGYESIAERVARRWLKTNLDSFMRKGDFFDKYNVVDISSEPKEGLYPTEKGYAWTNAVFSVLAREYRQSLS